MIKKRCNRQMGGFALTTVAWIICCISMGLPQWRVWRFQDPIASKPTTAFVGMWRVCVFHHDDSFSDIRICHRYNYQDTFIPLDIRVAQQLLLVSSFLGLVGKITTIISLWNVCVGRVHKNSSYNPFGLSGILNIIASSFVCLAVFFNYVSIIIQEEIAFPPSFHMPSHPDTQEIGSAMALAVIAAILFLLSGTILLSSNIPTGKPARSKN
ncbi:claudin-34 [Phodopus roborovskii]|uniref:Cldn34b4 protein n=1 Tax=Phodopus roborovskii TaxID=109678 RepID=A0AAU9Z0G4_PHORO|nr:claudin-34 [Phodopus roborovskii]XP_051035496.1 claudin-34 [Phodopus roborovskii]CAH6784382.1 Cldn34b4 [Phodopus roborovskii]